MCVDVSLVKGCDLRQKTKRIRELCKSERRCFLPEVATVRKEGVLAKLTESRPKRLTSLKGRIPMGGLWRWIRNTFGWLWINDNGKTIFDKTPKVPLNSIQRQSKSLSQLLTECEGHVYLSGQFSGPMFVVELKYSPESLPCE
jgi:hypothetical protein